METPKGYKPLVETPEGELISVWAGKGGAGCILTYKEGEITYNPEGKAGIWVSETLEQAKASGFGNKNKIGVLVVYEVTPLGERMREGEGLSPISTFGRDTRYPAILLGKEVWSDKPKGEPRPEPKFKVGDRVVGVASYAKDCLEEPRPIVEVFWGADRGLGGTPSYWLYKCDDGINYSDNMLELAPVEEWVDVTKGGDFTLSDIWYCSAGRGKYKITVDTKSYVADRPQIAVLKKK